MKFEHQHQFAWEHFKFHADQRTKMFRFFLIVVGLLMTAFSFLVQSHSETGASAYAPYSFVLFYAGGFLSTIFLGLDVRNTQLIEHSESILRSIETRWLFSPESEWCEQTKGEDTKLGLLSRDALLKDFLQKEHPNKYRVLVRWFFVDNITHTFAIRSIYLTSIFLFWFAAYVLRKPDWLGCWRTILQEWTGWIEIGGLLICLLWSRYALVSPQRDARWERDALRWKRKNDRERLERLERLVASEGT